MKPKLDIGLFVDFCVFNCFYQVLHDVLLKLICKSKQFYEHMLKLVKTGECMSEGGGSCPSQILADQKAPPAPHYCVPPQIFRLWHMPAYYLLF